ncbi:hypothetical protein OOZ19_06390 [Saccharopolyspora sp. NFXS83]|uniref:hypothetical protein n=1 Tax=Saccharopolyspora sp. NFXS83 TaxID=2993560 RepID=UPI00224ADE46|nr:hypothetical protein [Saccharopolyspora sp. NFXS83]MCX2729861.1 hypothetical protein [Saccharopolyspora sp. NFXS83]
MSITNETAQHDGPRPHPLDVLVNDPTGMRPLCDERMFSEIMAGIVADSVPRVFAVVQEYGERVDGRIAAWGLALDDHVQVVSVLGRAHSTAPTAEDCLREYRFGTHIRPRIVWYDPEQATPAETEDD